MGLAAQLGPNLSGAEVGSEVEESNMPAPFVIRGLDHIVLRAHDPQALERFYIDVLGCQLEKRQGTLTQLRAGQALIDIVPEQEAVASAVRATANLDHLCLRIDPFDATAITAHFAAHGVACGEEKSRYGAEGQGPSVYLNDPEGNGVELKGPVEG